MAFAARIGVGDTIVSMTDVGGRLNAVLWLEASDGDIGDVVAEWSGDDLKRALADGQLVEAELHRTAYSLARASGAFDVRERALAEAAAVLEPAVLREMGDDLASSMRPWDPAEDEDYLAAVASAAAARLLHAEGGALALAPRGIRHDAVEHLAGVGLAAEAALRAGPDGADVVIGGRRARLVATGQGDVEIRIGEKTLLARAAADYDIDTHDIGGGIVEAVRSYIETRPRDVAAAAYASMVQRSRHVGRMAAELEAHASLLLDERDGIAAHIAGVIGVGSESPSVFDDRLPAPRF